MKIWLHLLWTAFRNLYKSRRRLASENLLLRHQLKVEKRRPGRRVLVTGADRAIFVWLYRHCPEILNTMTIVRPETVSATFRRRVHAIGIRDRPASFRSPWQNGYAERVIGTIRRERLDHMFVVNQTHLRRALTTYAKYYNHDRTHQSLAKDARVERPIEPSGAIGTRPVLAGLHHHYARIQ
jgi:Integrase core domain